VRTSLCIRRLALTAANESRVGKKSLLPGATTSVYWWSSVAVACGKLLRSLAVEPRTIARRAVRSHHNSTQLWLV